MIRPLLTSLLMVSLFIGPMGTTSASNPDMEQEQSVLLARSNASPKAHLRSCYAIKDKDEARLCISQVRRRAESNPVDLRTRRFQTSSLPTNTRKDATSTMSRRTTHCLVLKDPVEREGCVQNASSQKGSRRTTVIHTGIPFFLPNDQCGGLRGEDRSTCINEHRVSRPDVHPPKSARILKMKARSRDR